MQRGDIISFAADRRLAITLGLLTGVVMLPALIFPFPPLLDYPNHLARIWLIEGGIDIAPVNTFYLEDWSHVGSGIGVDLAAKTLGHFVAPFTLGGILLVLSTLLPPLGAVALNARVFRGLNAWQPFFLMFWCSQTLVAGFLNFQIGLGTALLAAAADDTLRARGPWALHGGRLALGVFLVVVHPFALLFYAVLLAALGFGRSMPGRSEIAARLSHGVGAAAVCLVPVALFFLRVRAVPGLADKTAQLVSYTDPLSAFQAMVSPFASYDLKIDALFMLPFLALTVAALMRRRISAHAGLLLAAAVLAAIAPFMPKMVSHTGWMNFRLPLMAVLTALAATRLDFGGRNEARLLATAAALVMLRTAWIGLNWSASVPMIDSMRQVLAHVPLGAKILPMRHLTADDYFTFAALGRRTALLDATYRHYPSLALPWRHAFTPMLFAQYGEKPITLRPPYDKIGRPTGGVLPSVHALNDPNLAGHDTPYIGQWRRDFDYVLVLNADEPDVNGPFLPPADLMLVSDHGFAQLFRVLDAHPGGFAKGPAARASSRDS